jgi:hypothetical protein
MTIASPYASIDDASASRSRRSLLRRFTDFLTQGRRRKASATLVHYLRDHKHSLDPQVRAELERRLINS